MNAMVGPLDPVRFKVQELPFPIEWEVSIEDDGTLVVCAVGRRPGRILVEPSSNQLIRVKTNVIVRRSNKVITNQGSG